MSRSNHRKNPTLGTPATYRISVQGSLDESWTDHLGGLAITTKSQGDQAPVSNLVGRLRDQSALIGILNSRYGLHLPLLSVELLTDE